MSEVPCCSSPCFPRSGLLGLLLAMERVEQPLRKVSVVDELAGFLDTAHPDEVEAFVSEGLAPALDRYWKRRRLARLLPGPAPREVTHSRRGPAQGSLRSGGRAWTRSWYRPGCSRAWPRRPPRRWRSRCTHVDYSRGETVFVEGEQGDTLFIV